MKYSKLENIENGELTAAKWRRKNRGKELKNATSKRSMTKSRERTMKRIAKLGANAERFSLNYDCIKEYLVKANGEDVLEFNGNTFIADNGDIFTYWVERGNLYVDIKLSGNYYIVFNAQYRIFNKKFKNSNKNVRPNSEVFIEAEIGKTKYYVEMYYMDGVASRFRSLYSFTFVGRKNDYISRNSGYDNIISLMGK